MLNLTQSVGLQPKTINCQKAVYFCEASRLENYQDEFDRLYFGSEFCENRIPEIPELEKAVNFALKRSLSFTFVSGYLTNAAASRLRKLIPLFSRVKFKERPEVVVNDWGTLRIFKSMDCSFSLGRLLIKHKSDPRIIKMREYYPDGKLEFLSELNINDSLVSFMKENGINRIEIDNTFQGVNFDNKYGLGVSVYVPFGCLSASRICHQSLIRGKKSARGILEACSNECNQRHLVLENKEFGKDIYLKGKALFFRNDDFSKIINDKKIKADRIVYEPFVPV